MRLVNDWKRKTGVLLVVLSAVVLAVAYVGTHPFRPTRAILPDDFIPVPQGP